MVSDAAFQDALLFQSHKIPYINSTEIDLLPKFDFIIISDKEGYEIIRNFINIERKVLEYTSCFNGDKCNNITLTVIMALLYHSIMWIRHGTYTERKLFSLKNFPVERLKREVHFIDSILKLCEGKIKMTNFINILELYIDNADDFPYISAVGILDKYTWQFELTDIRKEKIELIKSSLDKIIDLLKSKSTWKEIHKVGYKIHNEPFFIYKNATEF